MDLVGITARMVVGVVLIVAGIAKLRDRTWGTLALEVGTPRFVVLTLPAAECLLGLALLLQLVPRLFGAIAVCLFLAFTIVVANRFRTGSQTPCHCFGAEGDQEPVTSMTIVRNVVLLILALAGALL